MLSFLLSLVESYAGPRCDGVDPSYVASVQAMTYMPGTFASGAMEVGISVRFRVFVILLIELSPT